MESLEKVTGKRQREVNEDENPTKIRALQQEEQNEVFELLNKSDTEILFDSLRAEFRDCSFIPMIYIHQLAAFYKSISQVSTLSTLTCTQNGHNTSAIDSGELDREIYVMRRANLIKVIVPRVGHIHDSLIVNTEDYIRHLSSILQGSLLIKFSSFLQINDHMSFSKQFLMDEGGLDSHDIDELLTQGVLRKDNFMSFAPNVNTEDVTTSSLWLSSPAIGSILGVMNECELFVVRLLKKGKYKELLESKLSNTYRISLSAKLGSKILPWRFVMLELYHRGKIQVVKSPRGSVIRLQL